jgi:hypothetical protein
MVLLLKSGVAIGARPGMALEAKPPTIIPVIIPRHPIGEIRNSAA